MAKGYIDASDYLAEVDLPLLEGQIKELETKLRDMKLLARAARAKQKRSTRTRKRKAPETPAVAPAVASDLGFTTNSEPPTVPAA